MGRSFSFFLLISSFLLSLFIFKASIPISVCHRCWSVCARHTILSYSSFSVEVRMLAARHPFYRRVFRHTVTPTLFYIYKKKVHDLLNIIARYPLFHYNTSPFHKCSFYNGNFILISICVLLSLTLTVRTDVILQIFLFWPEMSVFLVRTSLDRRKNVFFYKIGPSFFQTFVALIFFQSFITWYLYQKWTLPATLDH